VRHDHKLTTISNPSTTMKSSPCFRAMHHHHKFTTPLIHVHSPPCNACSVQAIFPTSLLPKIIHRLRFKFLITLTLQASCYNLINAHKFLNTLTLQVVPETELLHSAGVDNVMSSACPADQASTQAAPGTCLLPTAAADYNISSHLAEDENEPEVPSDYDMDKLPSPIAEQQVGPTRHCPLTPSFFLSYHGAHLSYRTRRRRMGRPTLSTTNTISLMSSSTSTK
jgi:hypothetical protein